MGIPTGRLRAFACIAGGADAPSLSGVVKFYETRCGVLLQVQIYGLPQPDGFHGFHIHEGGACKGENFSQTGNHYDPEKGAHPNHSGDLPPLLSCNGIAYMQVLTNRFSIDEVVGRTIVIHARRDDFHSQPGGDAGDKIACGVICRCARR